jgi:hypothetical protein
MKINHLIIDTLYLRLYFTGCNGGQWWYSVGARQAFQGGLTGPGPGGETKVELYVQNPDAPASDTDCTSATSCGDLGWAIEDQTCAKSSLLHDGLTSLDSDSQCHGADDSDTGGRAHAAAICLGVGARLCTVAELEAEVARGTGCGHDSEQTWASDLCGSDSGGFMSAQGQAGQNPICQTNEAANLVVRCCADVTPDANRCSYPGPCL